MQPLTTVLAKIKEEVVTWMTEGATSLREEFRKVFSGPHFDYA